MIANTTPTDEQQRLMQTEPQTPVVIDSAGSVTHAVSPIDEARRLVDEHVCRELEIGFKQADSGDWVAWDPEKIKAEGRRRHVRESNEKR